MGWVNGGCATVNPCTEKAAGSFETSATHLISVRFEKLQNATNEASLQQHLDTRIAQRVVYTNGT
jgi:hypothetical protein